jgi:putative multiple sugar transport system permease protein
VVGSIIGGLVMAVLNNGLQLKGIGADATQMIKGLVLLIAVAFDVLNKMQGRPSLIGRLTRGKSVPTVATEDPAAVGKVAPIQDTV